MLTRQSSPTREEGLLKSRAPLAACPWGFTNPAHRAWWVSDQSRTLNGLWDWRSALRQLSTHGPELPAPPWRSCASALVRFLARSPSPTPQLSLPPPCDRVLFTEPLFWRLHKSVSPKRASHLRYVLYQIKLEETRLCFCSCYKDENDEEICCKTTKRQDKLAWIKSPEECNACLFCVYIFAIYFLYIDRITVKYFLSHVDRSMWAGQSMWRKEYFGNG